MRADELQADQRIKHPVTDQIVTVVRTHVGLAAVKVYFKAYGQHGRFNVSPHRELGEA